MCESGRERYRMYFQSRDHKHPPFTTPYSVNLENDYEPRQKIKPYTTTNLFIAPLHNEPLRVSQILFRSALPLNCCAKDP
jgi:cellulose synthase/poly-beta-1,6-N-acetylglucosamine synthase-like glycosyltransferase